MDDSLLNIMRLDPPIENFIEIYANSFVKWEAVQYFYEHPDCEIRLTEIAKNLNRPSKIIKKDLEELAQIGFLRQIHIGSTLKYIFHLEQDAAGLELKKTIEQFINLCQEREGRLRVVYKLLKNGKPVHTI